MAMTIDIEKGERWVDFERKLSTTTIDTYHVVLQIQTSINKVNHINLG